MQGVIITSRTIAPSDDKYNFYSGKGYTEYLEDLEKHWNEKEDGKIPEKMLSLMKEAQKQATFLNYQGREEKFSGKSGEKHLPLFDKYGNTYFANSAKNEIAKGSNVYSLVISLPEEISKLNKDTLDYNQAKSLAKTAFDNIMIANANRGFDAKYFNYDAVLHLGTKKSHIHMRIYQPKGTPKDKIMDRCSISLWGFNSAKLAIAQQLEGLKQSNKLMEDIYSSKVNLQKSFKSSVNLEYLNSLKNDKDIQKEGSKQLGKSLDALVKMQGACYKIFRQQPVNYHYVDKKTGKEVNKQGLNLSYDNLNVPVYKLEDIKEAKSLLPKDANYKDVENKLKELNKKKQLQPEQVAYKKLIQEFTKDVISVDQVLNKQNKEFNNFCETWKTDVLSKVGPSSKENQRNDRIEKVVEAKLNRSIINDFEKNVGNHIMKCVTAYINKNKYSPVKTNLTKKNIIGGICDLFSKMYVKNYKPSKNRHTDNSLSIKNISSNWMDLQLREFKQKMKLEKMAADRDITVEELKQELEIN